MSKDGIYLCLVHVFNDNSQVQMGYLLSSFPQVTNKHTDFNNLTKTKYELHKRLETQVDVFIFHPILQPVVFSNYTRNSAYNSNCGSLVRAC